MRNAPAPKGMVTAFLLGIVVKNECIVNAFNILSTFIRQTKRTLPLVKFKNILDFKDTYIGFIIQSIKVLYKKERQPFRIAFPFLKRDLAFQMVIYCMTVTRFTVTPFSV